MSSTVPVMAKECKPETATLVNIPGASPYEIDRQARAVFSKFRTGGLADRTEMTGSKDPKTGERYWHLKGDNGYRDTFTWEEIEQIAEEKIEFPSQRGWRSPPPAPEPAMSDAQPPQGVKDNEASYKADAWRQYALDELGQWVHLLVKRAGHRDNPDKRAKDLTDAQNYLDMMQAHVNHAKEQP